MNKKKIISFILIVTICLNISSINAFSLSESSVSIEDFNKQLCLLVDEYDSSQLASSGSAKIVTNRLVVKTKDNSFLDETYGAVGCVEGYNGIHILQYQTPVKADNAYNKFLNDDIEYVEYDFYINVGDGASSYSGDSLSSNHLSWNSDVAQVEDAFKLLNDYGIECQEVVVAILDTGLYADHEYFKSNRIVDSGYARIDEEKQISYPSLVDDLNHGTHVAGIIYDNTMDNVKLCPYRVFAVWDQAPWTVIWTAFDIAVANGADIINMSLGDESSDDKIAECSPFLESIERAVNNNVVVVIAAGNDQSNADRVVPGKAPSAITVAATDERNLPDISYSASGNCVDIAAPGTNINSTVPRLWTSWQHDVKLGHIYEPTPSSLYKEMKGTSMATPLVTAAAAMLKSIRPDLSAMEIQQTIKNTAYVPENWASYCGEKNYGVGIVNFYNIVRSTIRTQPEIKLNSYDKFEILPTAGSDSTYYTLDGTEPTPENGFVYSSPLDLSNKTVSFIKAASYRNGEQTGKTVTYKMFRYETVKMNYKETEHPFSDNYTKKIRWKSADPTVATVDSEGNIKGVSVGEAQVTAKLSSGKRVIYNVKVEYSKLQWFIMIFLCGFLWY